MKKIFLKLSALLFVLTMGVNAAWAQDGQAMYIAALKAQASDASTGAGNVKLTWVDAQGVIFTNPLVAYLNDPSQMGASPFATGNPSNNNTFGATATIVGATMTATESMEESSPNQTATKVLRLMLENMSLPTDNIFMTPYAYFKADAEGANGSYFYEWTFNDPRVTRQDTAMDKNHPESAYFKILPNAANVYYLIPPSTVTGLETAYAGAVGNPNIIYAVFKKYLLANPVATSANMEATPNAEANLTVTVEINGDAASLDAADFATFTFTNNGIGEWEYDLDAALASKEVVSAQKTRITIPVTYTYKNTGYDLKNTTMTISMAGASPSTLNVNLSVDALNPSRPAAFLLEGKDDAAPKSGTLAEILAMDISGYTDPIVKLNKPVEDALTFSEKNFTLDLNGNTAQAITVSSGNVTIAYSKYVGSATSLAVNGGKAILNGGTFGSLTIGASGTVEQNGATITGAASNAGSLTTTEGAINGGLTSSNYLEMNGGTFKGTTAVTVSGGKADINRGAIEGTTCGLKVEDGAATTKKLAAIKGATYSAQQTGGTLTVESGKFDGPLNGTIAFTAGFFKTNTYGISTEGKTEMKVSAGMEYNEGYRYFLGTAESALANGVGVCRIGEVSYAKLEDAIAYANNNQNEEVVIFMTNNYTLPAGYYTIPAKATLVVPMSDTQAKEVNQYAPHISNNKSHVNPYVKPYEFRRLTFANGVNMDVFGEIEVTGTQFADENAYTSQPCGAYGHIVMEEGSHITLMANSEFRAWGFVTGKGEMDARRDAKVREMFQLGDWKGAFTSVVICGVVKEGDPLYGAGGIVDKSDNKVFPVTQYWIQNIESPVKYHPGAVLATSATVTESVMQMPISMVASDILIVGVANRTAGVSDPAIFLLDNGADADNTWIRKWYDAENDIQVYEINSAAHIGSMELDMGTMSLMGMAVDIKLNSALFDLPITSNMKIHLLSGSMDFQQNTCLLPGTEVEVDKEATVTVSMASAEKDAYDTWVDEGKSGDAPVCYTGALYVYDKAQWDKYAFDMNGNHGYTKVVRYAPSWEGVTEDSRPNIRHENVCPASAKINVRGTFDTDDGYVYTTGNGANIFSSNDNAGTFIFRKDVSEAVNPRKVYQVKVGDMSGLFARETTFEEIDFIPAKLKNGDGSYTESYEDAEHYAKAGDAYCYQNDEWSTLTTEGCFMVKHNDETGDIYYAKPQEYVAVAATETAGVISGNADHTFSDAAGTGRLFILMENCQWWEVEKKDNLYHCIHPKNDTYYYWDDSEEEWMEKKCTITWKNWNGDIIQTRGPEETMVDEYEVTYGTVAEFFGANPTREPNVDSTYNFTGWKPALGPVTQDVTYTATFASEPRMYTIIFQNEGESEIERQFLEHNAVPECENTPTKIGHTLVWSPAISPVVGDQTYIATWLENPPTEWDVTFVNNAGGVLKATHKVGVSEHPEYISTPAKENADHTPYSSNEYAYTFWGWSAVIDGVAQQFAAGAELPCPTAPTTYTAVYTEGYQTYAVTFKKEDPENPGQYVTIETNNYRYGETPVCSATPTKENTPEWTYGFAWTPNIQTVQGAATYTATFPATKNRYTVTLTSNLSGVCTFTGAGTFDYYNNEGKEPEDEGYVVPKTVTVSYDSEKYNFLGWEDGEENASRTIASLESDVTFTANFSIKSMPNLEIAADGSETLTETTEVKDFVLTSNGVTSGEIIGANYLDIKGEAIFRMQPETPFAAGTWYAVAVPWRVDPNTGIYGASSRLASGSQIYIIEFDGAAYANADIDGEGKTTDTYQYWHFLHQTGADMVPGKLYMVYLTSAQSKLDFHKKAGAALQTRNLTVSTASGSAGAPFANWNAISNPALYTADLSTGVTAYQTYDNNGDQTYTVVNASTSGLIVAKPIFVQVNTPSTVYATIPAGPDPAPAYRRAAQAENDAKFVVEISRNDKMADRLIVETADEKADKYVIGQDLAKFGVSSKVAQMWINRYESKLCKNTVEFNGERIEYPLSIFTPVAGEYMLAAAQQSGDEVLYLTYNGEAIWNLSEGEYTVNLEKGIDTNYGLRVSARAPQITTGIDEAVVDAKGETRKVLINNQVYIIRGEKVYAIDGQLVR